MEIVTYKNVRSVKKLTLGTSGQLIERQINPNKSRIILLAGTARIVEEALLIR